uniref:Olfactory receptor n=1 Tax=Leptobrachium leishanense TaxID=445787 RepID=A0A8C5M8A5_9ANUR
MFEMNQTEVTEFKLMGLQDLLIIRPVLFLFIITIYVLTLCGNLLIIVLVAEVPSLKSPMYFFLTQLSLSDILLTTNITPNLLHLIIHEGSMITITRCITQYYLYGVSAGTECLLLTVMSYDRYLAICKPLHYISIMDLKLQLLLALMSWVLSCLAVLFHVCLLCNLRFCGPHVIDHYFCDLEPIVELSCSEHTILDISFFIFGIFFVLCPFSYVLFSYTSIFITISHISSTDGKQKAFSTCSSHLIVVSIYYGTITIIYMIPSKGHKALSLLYTVFTPFINPIIYSLKNKDISHAIKNTLCKLMALEESPIPPIPTLTWLVRI